MKLLYEGKAKQLFQCENNEEIYIHYKNSATAFNGEKKEEFDKKGILNNTITSFIFEYLENKYNTIEEYFGVKKKPTLNDIMADYTAIKGAADWPSLKKLSKYVEDNGYAKTAMPSYFMAEYYEKTSDYKKALKTYQKAYTEQDIDFITGDLITDKINQLKSGGKK